MTNIKQKYKKEVLPQLQKLMEGKNVHAVPRIEKIVINSGLNTKRDPKFIEVILETLQKITGQKPVATKARKSEAGFKIRQGMTVGAMVTLRNERMWSFLDKLVNIVFPRVRDFRGIPESAVDSAGNFNIGFKEHLAFPEISPDAVDNIHGLQVTIKTTATNHEDGLALFRSLGFPFKKEEK